MNWRAARLLTLSAGLSLALQAPLQAATAPEPGLWEVSTKKERAGVVTPKPTRQRCITEEQSKEFGGRASVSAAASRRGGICSVVDWHEIPNGVTWRIRCAGPIAAEQTGRYIFDSAQHFTADFTSTATLPGRTMTSIMTIEARRIGECPK